MVRNLKGLIKNDFAYIFSQVLWNLKVVVVSIHWYCQLHQLLFLSFLGYIFKQRLWSFVSCCFILCLNLCFCDGATWPAEGDHDVGLSLKKGQSNPKFNQGPKVWPKGQWDIFQKCLRAKIVKSKQDENKDEDGLPM